MGVGTTSMPLVIDLAQDGFDVMADALQIRGIGGEVRVALEVGDTLGRQIEP